MQEIHRWRTRVVKGGRAAEDYLLRQLLYCERCGARMQGTRGSRAQHRRYQGTRRRGGDCTQTIVPAEPLEDQLVEWLRDFQPDSDLRGRIIDAIKAAAREQAGDQPERRRDLLAQLDRLQDLYVMRRQALEDEVQRIGPPIDPDIAKAETLLDDFAHFWEIEDSPGERQKLLAQLFDRIWQDGGQIVAVTPRKPFARYFQAADDAGCLKRERRDFDPPAARIEIRM